MDEDLYLIWSNEHRGWWRPGGWGYTPGLNQAGRFSRAQAIDICKRALPTALHIHLISEIPVRLADVEEMLKGEMVPAVVMTDEPAPPSRFIGEADVDG
jgi:hypothetical protein